MKLFIIKRNNKAICSCLSLKEARVTLKNIKIMDKLKQKRKSYIITHN